jgi:hypothetical protein
MNSEQFWIILSAQIERIKISIRKIITTEARRHREQGGLAYTINILTVKAKPHIGKHEIALLNKFTTDPLRLCVSVVGPFLRIVGCFMGGESWEKYPVEAGSSHLSY